MNYWLVNPFSLGQIVSWSLLIVSLALIYQGAQLLRRKGNLNQERNGPALMGMEKTTTLVTTGVYHYIRHPFYSSLLFLGWGILFKNVSWLGILLAVIITIFLIITARKEESENNQYFGKAYREYMEHTKMFIPFVF